MSATEWVQVGELSNGFQHHSNAPEASDALVGKSFDLHMENGWVIRQAFTSVDSMKWEILEGASSGESNLETCRVTSLRDGVFLVDFSKNQEVATRGTLVLNLESGTGFCGLSTLAGKAQCQVSIYDRATQGLPLPNASTQVLQFGIDRPFVTASNGGFSDILLGKKIRYRYSETEAYEHIYLNPYHYTWHCVEGVENGLADTDHCFHLDVGDDMVLFFWHEKIIPTVGTILIDLKARRTTGKLFGYKADDYGDTQAIPAGAKIECID